MLVFIDESGDPTMASQPWFVLAMVIFDNGDDARATEKAIKDLHINTRHKQEFKFSKCHANVRDAFFQGVRAQPFRIKAVIVDKRLVYSHQFRNNPRDFYNFFLKKLIAQGQLEEARIYLDGKRSREQRRVLNSFLRKGQDNVIRDFRLRDSRKDNLIQLADMVVGAIARSCYPEKADYERWRNMLRLEAGDIWESQ